VIWPCRNGDNVRLEGIHDSSEERAPVALIFPDSFGAVLHQQAIYSTKNMAHAQVGDSAAHKGSCADQRRHRRPERRERPAEKRAGQSSKGR
jgi:hypothetical protein